MHLNEYMLTVLGEEGVEIAQRVSKANRFGLNETEPGKTLNNAERIEEEFIDMIAVYQLCESFGVLRTLDLEDRETQKRIREKKAKVLEYMNYSREQGTLE